VEDATMRTRLADARVARLATVTREGRPHLVPCCFAVDGDVVVTAVDDVKPKSSMALRRLDNLAANPEVSLLVDHYADDWSTLWWIRVDGVGRVVVEPSERSRAVELLAGKYRQYAAEAALGAVIAIDIHTWRAWP
jgi:PPOX class probable F420-dependent enzyme